MEYQTEFRIARKKNCLEKIYGEFPQVSGLVEKEKKNEDNLIWLFALKPF